jgi:transcriptional regulator with XRE-family HTH domain
MNHPDALIVQAVVGLPMRLRAHRAARGLSLRNVARCCGVSLSTIHRIEHGEDYTVDSLIRVAAYLDEQVGSS